MRLAAILFDEDAHGPILAGLRLHHPDIDALGEREVLPEGTLDPDVLEWAAAQGRVVVTHDKRTMTAAARDRMRSGLPFPGMIVVPQRYPVGRAIRDIVELVARSVECPLEDRIAYLPLDKVWGVSERESDWAAATA
jgi:hypothetical protein